MRLSALLLPVLLPPLLGAGPQAGPREGRSADFRIDPSYLAVEPGMPFLLRAVGHERDGGQVRWNPPPPGGQGRIYQDLSPFEEGRYTYTAVLTRPLRIARAILKVVPVTAVDDFTTATTRIAPGQPATITPVFRYATGRISGVDHGDPVESGRAYAVRPAVLPASYDLVAVNEAGTRIRADLTFDVHGFSRAGALRAAHDGGTATLLADGRILVAGLCEGPDAETYDPAAGSSAATGAMVRRRSHHTAVRLRDGRVLVAGGQDAETRPVAATEFYDPATGRFQAGPALPADFHALDSLLLADGRVLLAGAGGLGTFDPGTGAFHRIPAPWSWLSEAHLVALLDGRVLVLADATAHLYDPAAGTLAPTGPRVVPDRLNYTATRLRDGRVLVAGGSHGPDESLDSAEVYDPAMGRFTPVGRLRLGTRRSHVAALLADGRVLVAGGVHLRGTATNSPVFGFLGSAEAFDPVTGTFAPAASLTRFRGGARAVPLGDGRVVVLGGTDTGGSMTSVEVYR